jgi:DNA polymerase epsilon subunit 3
MPKDVFDAMTDLEFSFMLPRLEAEVTKFTSIQADKRNTYRKKVREEKKGTTASTDPATSTPANSAANGDVVMEGADDGERATKRVRRESGDAGDGEVTEEEGDETADVEDEEVEDDEIEDEVVGEELTEDPLEEKEDIKDDDDDDDGNESD